ncbi:CDP-diacylglycerol--glycerol-3-phosphate 3-phosphatidyltransferase [Dinoroseobacter sp. S76]|uniref:CDP-diacylglycerol--glycerol-3-phosphate 3-phosphatidyltransferase n=1 Tax=Dinoroseobacter sp. S76 TaxID=3415124 RepID=UPI003C7CF6EB
MRWTIPNMMTIARLLAAPAVAVVFALLPRPLADWVALALFIGASLTDFLDGWIARAWGQTSRFGAMLDPIADKAMVITALAVVMALSALDPLVMIPAAVILFREVFVSGLREFLGADASKLAVTKLAKWKTTAQMVSIAVLIGAIALEYMHLSAFGSLTREAYQAALDSGPQDWNTVWLSAVIGVPAAFLGMALLWVAAVLTLVTGADYFLKSLPFLSEKP